MKGLSIGLTIAILLASIPAQAQRSPCVITYGRIEADGSDRVLRREWCDRFEKGYVDPDRRFFRFRSRAGSADFEIDSMVIWKKEFAERFPAGGLVWPAIDFLGGEVGPVEGACFQLIITAQQKPPDAFCEVAYRGADGLIYWATAQGNW